MRTIFDLLAQASIMSLKAASMDKLYRLMTMAFKYQVSLALRPKDILLVTLNHIDAMRSYVGDAASVKSQVDQVYRMLIETYARLSNGEFLLIRQTLLNFFQDMHTRVSIFLNDKVQNDDGRFVLKTGGTLPWETEIPGTIRSFDARGKSKNIGFQTGTIYSVAKKEGSFATTGNRVTLLGTNMYSSSKSLETSGSSVSQTVVQGSDMDTSNPDPLAKAHLDLLSLLIGENVAENEFRLNLFKNDEEEETAASVQPIVETAQSKKGKSSELAKIMGEESMGGKALDLLNLWSAKTG